MDSMAPRNSLNYLNAVFETAAQGILLVDTNGYILRTNPAFANILGYDPQGLKGKQFTEIVHKSPKVQRLTAPAKIHHFQHSTQFPVEMELTDKAGQAVPVKLRAVLIKNEAEKVVEAIGWIEGLGKDPGEKRLEQKVLETQETLQNILTNSGDAILVADANGYISLVNQAFLQMLGDKEDEIIGKHLTELSPFEGTFTTTTNEKFTVTQEYIDNQTKKAGELFEKGRVANYELYLTHKNKKIVPVEATLSLLQDPQGQRRGSIAIFRDITERKLAERKNQQAKDFLENIFKTSADGIVATDAKGKLMMVNDAVEKMTGYSQDELIGKDPIELIPKSSKGEGRGGELIKKLSADGIVTGFELTWLRKDKRLIDVEINTALLKDQEGKIEGAVASIRDITERKLAEKERSKLESQLQRARKMEAIGTLAGGVAHDLNNILGAIVGYPDLILDDIPEEGPLKHAILAIKQSGERAAAIVQDLLTLARRGVMAPEVVNLNNVVLEYLKTREYEKLKEFHPYVELETNLDNNLLNIMGSPVHLIKTIMNLVSNAAEAMPEGGKILLLTETRYIEKSIKGYDQVEEGDYVMLSVSDTGAGISEDDLKKIFDPFYTKKVMGRSGTGLGMSVVWGTVKDHKGYIDIESAIGIGTTFKLYFPVTRNQIKIDQAPLRIEEYTGNGEKILVIDDVKSQSEVASSFLKKLNYNVKVVANGEEAVEYMKNHSADLLVLDMIMDPGIDGLETYRKILKTHPNQKAIIASGYSETDRVKEAQRLGAGGYIKKPYTLEKMGLAVKIELGNRSRTI